MAAVPIDYVHGNAVWPVGNGNKIIVHLCNDMGHWGGADASKLDERSFKPMMAYQNYHFLQEEAGSAEPLELGAVLFVKVEHDIWVANLIGQHGTGSRSVVPAIRYEAVRKGLARVALKAQRVGASVHMNRIGCGSAGGTWPTIERIICDTLINSYVEVTVYDPPAVNDIEVETLHEGDY
jgi:O-acetyl-ADP-ribose deacetylase (regulator of RNase III)